MNGHDPWIQTYTGRQLFLLRPKPSDVSLPDVAHALALKARFNGHTANHVSVAQHSVTVSEHVPARLAAAGLFHDAGEYALPDVARPLKPLVSICDNGNILPFSAIEERIRAAVFEHEGIAEPSAPDWAIIKEADTRALLAEARDHMCEPPAEWSVTGEPFPEMVIPWTWQEAEARFLLRHEHLKREARP